MNLSIKDTQKIKVLIAMDGNSLKSFSEKVGISYSYFISVLSGRYSPSARTANKIAQGLNKEISDLFNVEIQNKRGELID